VDHQGRHNSAGDITIFLDCPKADMGCIIGKWWDYSGFEVGSCEHGGHSDRWVDQPNSGVLCLWWDSLHSYLPKALQPEQVATNDSGSGVGLVVAAPYGHMPVEVAVAGHLQAWLADWVAVGMSDQVLAWIQHGVPVTLWGNLLSVGIKCDFSGDQLEWLLVELPQLVSVGSVVNLGNSISQPIGINVVLLVNLVLKKGPR
jgi:hypothetical protein